MQNRLNFIANALESRLLCIKASNVYCVNNNLAMYAAAHKLKLKRYDNYFQPTNTIDFLLSTYLQWILEVMF